MIFTPYFQILNCLSCIMNKSNTNLPCPQEKKLISDTELSNLVSLKNSIEQGFIVCSFQLYCSSTSLLDFLKLKRVYSLLLSSLLDS